MMGLRIPKAHKAITGARRREHPGDVDLRYTVVGLGVLGLFAFFVMSDTVYDRDGGGVGQTVQVAMIASAVFMVSLYLVSKLCPLFPRRARWSMFHLCIVATVVYAACVLFVGTPLLPVAVVMGVYCTVIAGVSMRQIHKYREADRIGSGR